MRNHDFEKELQPNFKELCLHCLAHDKIKLTHVVSFRQLTHIFTLGRAKIGTLVEVQLEIQFAACNSLNYRKFLNLDNFGNRLEVPWGLAE